MTNTERIGFDIEKKEAPFKVSKSLTQKVKDAAENFDSLTDSELRELYYQVSQKKMQRAITRKALIIKLKERYGAWVEKREEKRGKKRMIKEEIRKVKERLSE